MPFVWLLCNVTQSLPPLRKHTAKTEEKRKKKKMYRKGSVIRLNGVVVTTL